MAAAIPGRFFRRRPKIFPPWLQWAGQRKTWELQETGEGKNLRPARAQRHQLSWVNSAAEGGGFCSPWLRRAGEGKPGNCKGTAAAAFPGHFADFFTAPAMGRQKALPRRPLASAARHQLSVCSHALLFSLFLCQCHLQPARPRSAFPAQSKADHRKSHKLRAPLQSLNPAGISVIVGGL